MNDKMKKIGKTVGSFALLFLIMMFMRHVVFQDNRKAEEKSNYISTITSYEASLSRVIRKDKEIKETKNKLKEEKKGTNEYNELLEYIRIDKKNIQLYTYMLQSYISELRYYEKKYPDTEPLEIENEKEIMNGTYLDPDYYEKEGE